MNTELFQLFQALHGQLEPVEAKLLFKTNGLGIQATTVYDSEKDILSDIVVREMENAMGLSVPIKVDWNYGNNWFEAH